MSYPNSRFEHSLAELESLDPQAPETSLPTAVHALENDELQALLVALLREWRSRVAIGQDNHPPARLNA